MSARMLPSTRFALISIIALGCGSYKGELKSFDPDRGEVLHIPIQDSTDVNAKVLLPAQVGDKVTLRFNKDLRLGKKPRYRIHAIQAERQIHFAYIYLDGSKLSLTRIDSLRDIIIAQLEQGVRFDTLAARYNMDGNKTGELGWVKEDNYIEEFTTAGRHRRKGEVFKVDEPSMRWYHVVKKLDDDRTVPIYILWKL